MFFATFPFVTHEKHKFCDTFHLSVDEEGMREASQAMKQLAAATENISKKNDKIKALEEKVEALATKAPVSEATQRRQDWLEEHLKPKNPRFQLTREGLCRGSLVELTDVDFEKLRATVSVIAFFDLQKFLLIKDTK